MCKEYLSKEKLQKGYAVEYPYIIGIEGIDGSGKGTQSRLLYERLVREGFKVKLLDFPNYDKFYGKEIGRLLSGEDKATASSTEPKSMSLWYALDRKETFDKIKEEILGYEIILMNRSTYSNIGYQTARIDEGQEDFIKWVKELEHDKLGIPKPDSIYFCDISVETSGKNVLSKGERDYVAGKDVYEAEEDLLSKVQKVYVKVSEEDSRFKRINCMVEDGRSMRDIGEIHEEIYQRLLYDMSRKLKGEGKD